MKFLVLNASKPTPSADINRYVCNNEPICPANYPPKSH